MEPKLSVCRRGDELFLTIRGDFNHESSPEFFRLVGQLLIASLNYAAPGSQVTYCLKTRGKVDLDKISQFQPLSNDQQCRHESCDYINERLERGLELIQDGSRKRRSRGKLFLVKR